MRILIAEDEPVSRLWLQTLLTNLGYDVVVCQDGLTAWTNLQEPDPPKIAVLDWMMPGMDGLQVCRAVREQADRSYTYIVLLTGKNQKGDRLAGFEAGADDFLTKPVDEDELLVRLRTGQRILSWQDQLIAANRELHAAHQQADRVFAALTKTLAGTVLDGKYHLVAELGVGGFGVVFRGRHLVLGCPIAIKVFRPVGGNDSAEALQRFLHEGAMASRIDHPNAVRVLDSGISSDGVAFLIMELLEGQSAAQELRTGGPLSLRRAASIASRVADVLAAAHQKGIIHRDIKADNVFLHQTDHGEVVKVVDFGIAELFSTMNDIAATRLTGANQVIGTLSFIAPERTARKPDDGRSDVFSLGVLMYQMICGVTPWTEGQLSEMATLSSPEQRPRSIALARSGVPSEFEALILKSMSWEPNDRPTAATLAPALARLAESLDDGPARIPVTSLIDEMSAMWTQKQRPAT